MVVVGICEHKRRSARQLTEDDLAAADANGLGPDPGPYVSEAMARDGSDLGRCHNTPAARWRGEVVSDKVDESVPLRYAAKVKYSGHEGRKLYHDADLVLDLTPYKHTLIERDDLHQIYQNLKEIKTLMKSWTSDQRLRINTVTQAELEEQHRRWREERAARRAA